jgi:hypothetical protein
LCLSGRVGFDSNRLAKTHAAVIAGGAKKTYAKRSKLAKPLNVHDETVQDIMLKCNAWSKHILSVPT